MNDTNVVVTGRLREGTDRNGVLAQLTALFNEPVERVERLVQGRPVVIKRGVDAATAQRYVQRLTAIGVECKAMRESLELDADALGGPEAPAISPSAQASNALPPVSTGQPTPDELWTAVAQKRAAYYVPRWQRYAAGVRTFPSWHWPALFLTGWWALYRKSWAGAAALFLLPIGVAILGSIASALFHENETGTTATTLLGTVVGVLLPPMLANGFYYRKALKLIAEARAQSPDVSVQHAYLLGKGGTSGSMAVVATVFAVVFFTGILAAIALPAYQDYVVRAKVASVLAAVAPLQQQIVDTYQRTNELPKVDHATLNGVPGAEYVNDLTMDDHGVLTMSVNAVPGTTSHLLLTPRQKDNVITWTCQSPDTPAKYLPMDCRR